MTRTLKLLVVAGARPNFMKIAPLLKAFAAHNERSTESDTRLEWKLVHTGQHYDTQMSDVFFTELGIPAPDINLGIGSGSHAAQTAAIMAAFEPVILEAFNTQLPTPIRQRTDSPWRTSDLQSPDSDLGPRTSDFRAPLPDWVVVVGDVNSTMACTLVAAKMGIRVAHVEAGLRSFDRTMPEEINRIVTDALADLLLIPSEDAGENLQREGVPETKIRFVGNIMIDSLVSHLENANNGEILGKLGLSDKGFIYVTLHRPSNVDDRESLSQIVSELKQIAASYPVVFPIHPRTTARMREFGLSLDENEGVHLLDPIGYGDSLALTRHARCVLTDSGGLQEESTYFRTPCLTLRPNTERPVTITHGSNRLTRLESLQADFAASLNGEERSHQAPPLWDGHTAERIVEALIEAY